MPDIHYNIPSNNRELQLFAAIMLSFSYYNIPSNNRELQLDLFVMTYIGDYNIPSNNRELQRWNFIYKKMKDYNIPSNNRELQPTLVQILIHFYYNILTELTDCLHKSCLCQVIVGNLPFCFSL